MVVSVLPLQYKLKILALAGLPVDLKEDWKIEDEGMKTKEFISALATATDNRVGDTGRLLEAVTALMGDHFAKGDSVQMAGLGTFEVRKKLERIIVNPGTGQRMLVPPKLTLAFKPYLAMKASLGARASSSASSAVAGEGPRAPM